MATEAQLKAGNLWVKGQSGNPNGRPKDATNQIKQWREMCREFMLDEGWAIALDIVRNGKSTDRQKMLQLLAEYGMGKPQALVMDEGELNQLRIVIEGAASSASTTTAPTTATNAITNLRD